MGLLTTWAIQNEDNNTPSEENDYKTTTTKKETKTPLSILHNDKKGESYTIDNNGLCINHQCYDGGTKKSMISSTTTTTGILYSLTMLGSALTDASLPTTSDVKNEIA